MPAFLAITTDALHIFAMVAWALGLPLLVWHRWPRLSLGYTLYAIVFVLVSQVSHYLLGECFLTTLSRYWWELAGDHAAGTFMVRLVNRVAGVRPDADAAVFVWEVAIFVTSVAVAWSLFHGHRLRRRGRGFREESGPSLHVFAGEPRESE